MSHLTVLTWKSINIKIIIVNNVIFLLLNSNIKQKKVVVVKYSKTCAFTARRQQRALSLYAWQIPKEQQRWVFSFSFPVISVENVHSNSLLTLLLYQWLSNLKCIIGLSWGLVNIIYTYAPPGPTESGIPHLK